MRFFYFLFGIQGAQVVLETGEPTFLEICRANASRAIVGSCDLFPEFSPCSANAGDPESWAAELDCRFADAFFAQQQSEEVFVTFIVQKDTLVDPVSGQKIKPLDVAIAQSAFKAIHLRSIHPVMLIVVDSAETPNALSAIEFPRLSVLHMRSGTEPRYSRIWMLKTRSMLMGLMGVNRRTVVAMDLDILVHKGIDRLFERAREEISSEYPYPIGPTHWFSRVPGNHAMGAREYPCDAYPCDENVTTCNPAGICRNRPMRWTQAGIYTFTEEAAPFLMEMYKFSKASDDEIDMNTKLWGVHAWKQWCRFIPWRSEMALTLEPNTPNLDAISPDEDKLYFPHGIPKVMIAVHGETDAAAAADWLKTVSEHEQTHADVPIEDRKLIYYRKQMWTKKDWISQNMTAETPCILPI